jgi:hypothetical protein
MDTFDNRWWSVHSDILEMKETIMIALILSITLQAIPIGYNGDDYQRPDIKERRLERQEDRRWQEEKWLRQQEQYRQWFDSLRRN